MQVRTGRNENPPETAVHAPALCCPGPRAPGHDDPAAAAVLALVSRHRDVSPPLLLNRTRGDAAAAVARQLAMYLTHVVLRRSYAEVGDFFGRDRTTVAHACARIEDLRELPEVEAELERLEAELAGGCIAGEATYGPR